MDNRMSFTRLTCLLARLSLLFAGILSILPVQSAVAHPQLMTSVRHRASIKVSPKNVDVTLELTIGEIPSFAERLLMDENGDRRISTSELEDYLKEQSEALRQAVSLSIAGQPVELLFLYEPEIDLGNKETSTASHLVFRLFYFARSPKELKTGDEIVLEDRLWSHAPGLGSFHVVGQDGVELVAEKTTSTLWSTPSDKKPLVIRARCHAVPANTRNEEGHSQLEESSNLDSRPRPSQQDASAAPPSLVTLLGAVVLFAIAATMLVRRHS